HPPVPNDRVRLRVPERIAHVERPAHRGGWRVDRVDLAPGLRPVEPVRPVGFPPLAPPRFEPIEAGLLGDATHPRSLRTCVPRPRRIRRCGAPRSLWERAWA